MVRDKVLVGSIDWVDCRGMIENVFHQTSEILDPPIANIDQLLNGNASRARVEGECVRTTMRMSKG